MSYLVLARKYRPQTFGEVYAQDHIVRIFKNAIESDRIGQAYLFTGSRGVGKTSVARILAKSLNCENGMSIYPCNECANCRDISQSISSDVIEIDGASNTGVDDVRELQRELLYVAGSSRYKIIIIDEVHMLSKNAFNALLKTLEEPPPKVIFIFATTEPHKVLPTIISRCQRFDFRKIPADAMVKRLQEIVGLEKIDIEEEALWLIAKKADGGMRDALSILDQVISYGLAKITNNDVKQIFGMVDIEVFNSIMVAITNNNPTEMLNLYIKVTEQCVDIQEVINNFLEYLRQCIYIKLGNTPLEISKSSLENIQKIVADFNEDEILYIINTLIQAKDNLRTSSTPEVLAELTFIKLSKIAEMRTLKNVLDDIKTKSEQINVATMPKVGFQRPNPAPQPPQPQPQPQPIAQTPVHIEPEPAPVSVKPNTSFQPTPELQQFITLTDSRIEK